MLITKNDQDKYWLCNILCNIAESMFGCNDRKYTIF